VSYLAADSLFPEWKIWTQFLNETTTGLRLDALAESHPIEVRFAGDFEAILVEFYRSRHYWDARIFSFSSSTMLKNFCP
jgi:hypothetical protein